MARKKKNKDYQLVDNFLKKGGFTAEETEIVHSAYYQNVFVITQKGLSLPKKVEERDDPQNPGKKIKVEVPVELFTGEGDDRKLTAAGESYYSVVKKQTDRLVHNMASAKNIYYEIYPNQLIKTGSFLFDCLYTMEEPNNHPLTDKVWKLLSKELLGEEVSIDWCIEVIKYISKHLNEFLKWLNEEKKMTVSTKAIQVFLNERKQDKESFMAKDDEESRIKRQILIWRLQRQFYILIEETMCIYGAVLHGKGEPRWVKLRFPSKKDSENEIDKERYGFIVSDVRPDPWNEFISYNDYETAFEMTREDLKSTVSTQTL